MKFINDNDLFSNRFLVILRYQLSSKYLNTQYPNNPPIKTNIRVTLNQTIRPVRNLISNIHMKLNTVAATRAIPIIHQVS